MRCFLIQHMVIKICGKEKDIKVDIRNTFLESDRDINREIYHRYCDTSLALKLINYKPKVFLEDGIKKIIEANIYRKTWQSFEKEYLLEEE